MPVLSLSMLMSIYLLAGFSTIYRKQWSFILDSLSKFTSFPISLESFFNEYAIENNKTHREFKYTQVNCDWNECICIVRAVYDTDNSSVFTRISTLSTTIIIFSSSLQHNIEKYTMAENKHFTHRVSWKKRTHTLRIHSQNTEIIHWNAK